MRRHDGDRRAALADALRANLRKRKEQQRRRRGRADESGAGTALGDAGSGGGEGDHSAIAGSAEDSSRAAPETDAGSERDDVRVGARTAETGGAGDRDAASTGTAPAGEHAAAEVRARSGRGNAAGTGVLGAGAAPGMTSAPTGGMGSSGAADGAAVAESGAEPGGGDPAVRLADAGERDDAGSRGRLWRLSVDGVSETDAAAVADILERSLGEAEATVAIYQSVEDGPWTVECLLQAGTEGLAGAAGVAEEHADGLAGVSGDATDADADGLAGAGDAEAREDRAAGGADAAEAAGAAETVAGGHPGAAYVGDAAGAAAAARDGAAEIAAAAEAAGAALLAAGFDAEVTVAPVADRDWVAESQKGLPPIRAGRFTVFGPHDRDRIAASRFAIEIEAARAFGTGHHATTRGCLIALDRIAARSRPRRALDVGTGTGVLAIAALKAGAAIALCTDIDPVAVRTARANARLAGVGPRARFLAAAGAGHRLVRTAAPFDLVFANILARPLIGLAPDLARLIAADGRLVLSGLRTADARPVIAAYRAHGLLVERRVPVGDWPTLILRRPPARSSGGEGGTPARA